MKQKNTGFTLIELMITGGCLTMVIILITSLIIGGIVLFKGCNQIADKSIKPVAQEIYYGTNSAPSQ
jgi:competence protein ComGC